jgi:hypothetical protein
VRRMHAWPRRWKWSFDNSQTLPQAIDPAYPVLQDYRDSTPKMARSRGISRTAIDAACPRRPVQRIITASAFLAPHQITSFMAVQKGSYDRPRMSLIGPKPVMHRPLHSITSSARASTVGGIWMPRAAGDWVAQSARARIIASRSRHLTQHRTSQRLARMSIFLRCCCSSNWRSSSF